MKIVQKLKLISLYSLMAAALITQAWAVNPVEGAEDEPDQGETSLTSANLQLVEDLLNAESEEIFTNHLNSINQLPAVQVVLTWIKVKEEFLNLDLAQQERVRTYFNNLNPNTYFGLSCLSFLPQLPEDLEREQNTRRLEEFARLRRHIEEVAPLTRRLQEIAELRRRIEEVDQGTRRRQEIATLRGRRQEAATLRLSLEEIAELTGRLEEFARLTRRIEEAARGRARIENLDTEEGRAEETVTLTDRLEAFATLRRRIEEIARLTDRLEQVAQGTRRAQRGTRAPQRQPLARSLFN